MPTTLRTSWAEGRAEPLVDTARHIQRCKKGPGRVNFGLPCGDAGLFGSLALPNDCLSSNMVLLQPTVKGAPA